MKFYVVVNYYLVSLSFKFYEDPCTNALARVVNVHVHVLSLYAIKLLQYTNIALAFLLQCSYSVLTVSLQCIYSAPIIHFPKAKSVYINKSSEGEEANN